MTVIYTYEVDFPREYTDFSSWRDEFYEKHTSEGLKNGYRSEITFDYNKDYSLFRAFVTLKEINAIIVTDGSVPMGDIPEGLNVINLYNTSYWPMVENRVFADLEANDDAILVLYGSVPVTFALAAIEQAQDDAAPPFETRILIDGELF